VGDPRSWEKKKAQEKRKTPTTVVEENESSQKRKTSEPPAGRKITGREISPGVSAQASSSDRFSHWGKSSLGPVRKEKPEKEKRGEREKKQKKQEGFENVKKNEQGNLGFEGDI